jgi:hypothetical protein
VMACNSFGWTPCCIDKSNSVELAEAINSMFRWYRVSTKSYVYLPDVSRTAVNNDELAWESTFRKCRWFTRGRTFQELLAPTSVEFFYRESKRIGSKTFLEQQIYEITGIPNGRCSSRHQRSNAPPGRERPHTTLPAMLQHRTYYGTVKMTKIVENKCGSRVAFDIADQIMHYIM